MRRSTALLARLGDQARRYAPGSSDAAREGMTLNL